MSHGQPARTPANFPRMKHRAAARLRPRWRRGVWDGTSTGGYYCSEHGIRWTWTNAGAAEMDDIEQDIADHEDYHYSIGDDDE